MVLKKKSKQNVVVLSPLEIIDKLLEIKKEVASIIENCKCNEVKNDLTIAKIDELIEKAKQIKAYQEKVSRDNLKRRVKSKNKNKSYLTVDLEKENRKSDGVIILIVLAIRELECIKNIMLNNNEKLNLSDKTLAQTLNFDEFGQYITLASELATGIENNLVYNTRISSEELENYLEKGESQKQ